MSQYQTGTVAVTNASASVVGTGTAWTAALVGGVFKVEAVVGDYLVQSVESTTALTLATVYTGVTDTGLDYQVTIDFTSNYDFREIHSGDREWAYHLTQTIRAIDTELAALDPVAEHNIANPADAVWQGRTAAAVAGEILAVADQWKLLYCKDTGLGPRWYLYSPLAANTDNMTYLPTALLTTAAVVAAGGAIEITRGDGTLSNDDWTAVVADIGKAIYADDGGASVTAPSASGDVIKKIGTVLNVTANARNVFDISFSYPEVKI